MSLCVQIVAALGKGFLSQTIQQFVCLVLSFMTTAPTALAAMETALLGMSYRVKEGSRIRRFLDASSKTKMAIYLKMSSSMGAYMFHCAMLSGPVAGRYPKPQGEAIMRLLHAIDAMWNKLLRR